MAKTTTFNEVAGLRQALRQLPKEASAELRDASQAIASEIAEQARGRAQGVGRSYALVAPTIRASRDRVPVIKFGGTKKLPGRKGARQTVGDLIWGSEWGGRGRPTTQQFLEHRGTQGYALWPTVRENNDKMMEQWSAALLRAMEAI